MRETKCTDIEIGSRNVSELEYPVCKTSHSASLTKVVASQVVRVRQDQREVRETRRTRTKETLTKGRRLYDSL